MFRVTQRLQLDGRGRPRIRSPSMEPESQSGMIEAQVLSLDIAALVRMRRVAGQNGVVLGSTNRPLAFLYFLDSIENAKTCLVFWY